MDSFPPVSPHSKESSEKNPFILEEYKLFFEMLNQEIGLSATDSSGKIIYVNDKFLEISKYSREELIGQNHKIMKSGYHSEEFYKTLWNTINSGHVWHGEIKNQAKDGSYFWVDTSIAPIIGPNGKPEKYVAVRFPTTDQKSMQSIQHDSQYVRSLIEASLDPLVTINAEGKITDVNEASIRATGISREELIRTDFSNYFTEPEKAREGYQQVFAKGYVTDYPLTIRHKNGMLTDVLYNASVYKDAQGKVLGVFAAARDVTESRRIMRDFIETKNFLDNILQSSIKYSIIGKDLNSNILSWNEGARRNYGYTAEEIIGKNSSLLHLPKDINNGSVKKMLDLALEKGLAEGEFIRVRKDGSKFVASLVVTRRLDAAGNPIGFLLMSNDISESKKVNEQLHQASQYSRSLIEASLDPLVTINVEGKITDVNEASVKVTGILRNELIGTDFSNYFTEPERAREGYLQVFAQGSVADYPLTIRHKDGLLTDVLYNASVYKDANGNVLGVFAAARDVTLQKEASQYARNLIESSLDPLVTINVEGKITDVNEASVKVTGIPRDKLIGTDFSNYFTEPKKAREGYLQVFAKGSVADYPLTIRHRDGRLTHVLYNASVYKDSQGNVLGVFAAARDVTTQKKVEEELAEQRRKEQERLVELEKFQKITVGRELKMIELKNEIQDLKKEIESLKQKST